MLLFTNKQSFYSLLGRLGETCNRIPSSLLYINSLMSLCFVIISLYLSLVSFLTSSSDKDKCVFNI